MIWWLMGRSDHRGSDVRLASQELMRPSRISRVGIEHRWWRWRAQLTLPWRDTTAHINELEMRAALAEVKRRSRSARNHGTRYLHLVDSQVSLGVLTKRRSSAHVLNRVSRKICALELACNLVPVYAFVKSQHNPADRPSRRVRKNGKTSKGLRR